jgi:beta-phosphoglucomutase-like phosphatase (HAD superfamily)
MSSSSDDNDNGNVIITPEKNVPFVTQNHHRRSSLQFLRGSFDYAVFDLDGTLLDSETYSFFAMRDVAALYGKELTRDQFAQILGRPLNDSSVILISMLGLESFVCVEAWLKQYHENLEATYHQIPMQPGAAQFLHELDAAGIPIAIATSSKRECVSIAV